MTDTAPSHLDLDALADALAGEADADAAAHLAGCASCSSRLAELEAADARVVSVLGTLPAPEVPDGLADRLSAAFAAEQPLAPAGSTGTVTALSARAPKRRFLPAAAAAVLVLCGGGLGYSLLSGAGSDSGADEATSQAAGAGDGGLVLNASGTDYADEAAVAGVLEGVLRGAAAAQADGALRAEAAPGSESDPATGTGGATGTSPGPADAMTMQAPAAASVPVPDPLERLRSPEALQDCLASLASPDEPDLEPLALDFALYEGQPALAVVLPDPDPAKLSVFVLGPDCTRENEDLLTFFRVDRP
jgi:hypothetical protein